MASTDATPNDHAWRRLAQALTGALVRPGDEDYERARTIWNARFDRRPDGIAQCESAADVVEAVRFASEHGLLVAVRGGGHDYAGNSVCDGGLVIDLSRMRGVRVDPGSRTARVQGGARWRDVGAAAEPHGLAGTGGTVSTVGVGGYTLGGGFGHLSRQRGLAVDNLLSAEVVTSRGEIFRASETENADLFWALRGGGGNFGVVTEFLLQLHPIPPEVLVSQVIYPMADAGKALAAYRDVAEKLPVETTCYAFFIHVPPLPELPAEHHGEVAIDLVTVHTGDPAEGRALIEPLRSLGAPIADTTDTQPFENVQQMFDPGVPPGLRWYSRGLELDALSDEGLSTLVGHAARMPGPYTMVYLMPGGGAIREVPPDATAYCHRFAAYSFHILAGWSEAAGDEANMTWVRLFHEEMAPHAREGIYGNLLAEDEGHRVKEAYGENFERLLAIKRRWDPDNLFRMNHNLAGDSP
jgi:FAD/FMN-containing dehydrogenase